MADRTFAKFTFFKLDPAWQRRDPQGELARAGRVTLAPFRHLLGIPRRPAQLLLERFDAAGLTRRVGDEGVARGRARESL